MITRRQKQLSISDVLAFGVEGVDVRSLLEPRLRRVDALLDDSELVDRAYSILSSRSPQSRRLGRPGTPAETVLRLLVLKHLLDSSYERLEWEVRGSLAYRYFCRIGMGTVPDAKTMVRLGQLFAGDALRSVFERIVEMAVETKATAGTRMRVDTTVVEAPIRHPTDSDLCEDAIQVSRRSVRKLKKAGVELPFVQARVRTSMTRRMREVNQAKRLTKENRASPLKRAYRGLLKITRKAIEQARLAAEAAKQQVRARRGKLRGVILGELAKLETFIPRCEAVLKQTAARVLHGETRSEGKLVSIFEPETQILRRGKFHMPTEFGQLVKVQEAEGGIITDIDVVAGKNDQPLLAPSVDRHIEVFARPPALVTTDRGFFSKKGVEHATSVGVARVAVPKPGHKSKERTAYERQRWFKRARAWRAGGEARISRLKNHFGMRRSRYRGHGNIRRTAHWAGIANNLMAMATA